MRNFSRRKLTARHLSYQDLRQFPPLISFILCFYKNNQTKISPLNKASPKLSNYSTTICRPTRWSFVKYLTLSQPKRTISIRTSSLLLIISPINAYNGRAHQMITIRIKEMSLLASRFSSVSFL